MSTRIRANDSHAGIRAMRRESRFSADTAREEIGGWRQVRGRVVEARRTRRNGLCRASENERAKKKNEGESPKGSESGHNCLQFDDALICVVPLPHKYCTERRFVPFGSRFPVDYPVCGTTMAHILVNSYLF